MASLPWLPDARMYACFSESQLLVAKKELGQWRAVVDSDDFLKREALIDAALTVHLLLRQVQSAYYALAKLPLPVNYAAIDPLKIAEPEAR